MATQAEVAKRRFDEVFVKQMFSNQLPTPLPRGKAYVQFFLDTVPSPMGMSSGSRQPGIIQETIEFDDGSHLDILCAGATFVW
jgi:hypothetical protein